MSSVNNCSLQYCNTPQCKICRLQKLDTNPEFYSNLAYKKYKINGHGMCNTKNCIYLIYCNAKNCHMKYVGFTTTKLNKRLAGHRANILNGTEGCIMLDHFTKHHDISNMVIKPIDMCDGKVLRKREQFWMQELNTIFPYGLNNRIDIQGIHDAHEHVKSGNAMPIYRTFNTVKNNRTCRGSGKNKPGNDISPSNLEEIISNSQNRILFNPEAFITSITDNVNFNIHKHCRKLIMNLKLAEVRKLIIHVSKLLISDRTRYPFNQYLLYVIKDICLHRLSGKQINKTNQKNSHYIMVTHVNGLIDDININKIIHSKVSCEHFPAPKEFILNTGTTYKYSSTIRAKVVNYNEVVKNIDVQAQCFCKEHPEFIDQHLGHVITGNLDIITNKEVKTLLKNGLNFREKQPHNKVKALASIQSAIDKFIEDTSVTMKINVKLFSPWKKYVLEKVSDILNASKNTHPSCKVFNNQKNQDFLDTFQNQFVIVPVDKAAKNIGIICKAFYIQILRKEIMESGNFKEASVNVDYIINKYSTLLKKYNYKAPNNKDLPFIYWIPKFHKNPIDFRFITSGRNTVLNELSKVAGTGLKAMLKLEKTNCKFIHKFDGIKNFYIIEDNKEIIRFMVESNLQNQNEKHIKTFDFKTLYTKIPHLKLKDNIKDFISSLFTLKEKKYINISHKSAQFSDNKSKTGSFGKQEFIDLIDFLIENCFILNNNRVQQQIIGIPTGTNCASDLANIFLHVYEKTFVEKLIVDGNADYLDMLGTIFRYQDDLITFGKHIANNKTFTDIYPVEMVIKNTNISSNHVTYLDLDIRVVSNKFIFKSYDKRNDFNFQIINYPNLCGNIPTKAAYGVFISQLVRYTIINLNIKDFIHDIKILVNKLLKQGYKRNILVSSFKQFAIKYIVLWARFGVDISHHSFISAIF